MAATVSDAKSIPLSWRNFAACFAEVTLKSCSIYLQRNRDTYSKWADSGNITTIDLERGTFLIEHKAERKNDLSQ